MLLTILAWLLALAAAVPLAIFVLEVAVGLPNARRRAAAGSGGRVVVLIPSHNETLGVAPTIEALKAMAPAGTHILVVADNCSDDTAAVARAAGAEVIERNDATARGKGYALAFGRDHIANGEAPDVVVVMDADCRLAPGSVEALTAAAMRGQPAQAINLIAPDLTAMPMTQIGSFAMVVKNLYRSRGMTRMGGSALLTGTGMAFPWKLFAAADLGSASLVEDLGLGIELVKAGHATLLVEEAGVSSAPPPPDAALAQRTRWEHGFMHTARNTAMPLLGSGLRRGALKEVLLACHLLVPPLALLLMVATLVLAITLGLWAVGGSIIPAAMLATIYATALLLVFIAWLHGGRRWLSGTALLTAPLYILWKLPIYLGFVRRRETEWRRTERTDG
ncbi:MAG: glycosyltransferase [Sphingomonas sp.]|uniref:glycosyltransferase family 2 protein n=1 Tax=Sphingomonas sp. TaxID=28214 RepID=UPI001AC3626B|nr:glycosyltransferase family 2 protein [Sphingomonas sp.]MBN8814157.1 glycosyltransferase [Sphingomonas sp.]